MSPEFVNGLIEEYEFWWLNREVRHLMQRLDGTYWTEMRVVDEVPPLPLHTTFRVP